MLALVRRTHPLSHRISQSGHVATNWAWNYITFKRGTRLIAGMTGARMEAMLAPISEEPKNSGEVRHAA
jgi:hypothetical protein